MSPPAAGSGRDETMRPQLPPLICPAPQAGSFPQSGSAQSINPSPSSSVWLLQISLFAGQAGSAAQSGSAQSTSESLSSSTPLAQSSTRTAAWTQVENSEVA